MAILRGATIKLLINNEVYGPAQEVQYTIDYQENAIYGIDSSWPQEIAGGRCKVSGTVSGVRLHNSAGLQGIRGTTKFRDVQSAPYISIRIQDRITGEDILFIPQAKISNESTRAGIRSTVKYSFSFEGIVPYQPLDRS